MQSLWSEFGLPENEPLTKTVWESFMIQYIRRNAERNTNIFVVNATTPAQLFHALRRQVHCPSPVILKLLHALHSAGCRL